MVDAALHDCKKPSNEQSPGKKNERQIRIDMEQYSRKKRRITKDKVSANNPGTANEKANPVASERFPKYDHTYSRMHRRLRRNNSSSACDKGISVSSNKYPEVASRHSGLSRFSERRLDPLETESKKDITNDFRLSCFMRTKTNENAESSHHLTNNGGSLVWDLKNANSAKQSTMINANEKANRIASKRFPGYDQTYSRSYRGLRKNNSSSVFDKGISVSSNRSNSCLGTLIERPDPLDIELKKGNTKDFLLSHSTRAGKHDNTKSSHYSTNNGDSLVSDSRNASSVKQSTVSRRPGDFNYTNIKRKYDSTAKDKRWPKVVHTYRRRHDRNKQKEDNGSLGSGMEIESSRSEKNVNSTFASKDQLLPMSASHSGNCREDQAHGKSIDLRDVLAPQSTSTQELRPMTSKDDLDSMADANTGKSLCFSFHVENNQIDVFPSDCSIEEIGRSACTSQPSTQTQQERLYMADANTAKMFPNHEELVKCDDQDKQSELSGCHKEEKKSFGVREGCETENVRPVTMGRLAICTKKILLVLDLNGLLVDVTCISRNDHHNKVHKRVRGKSVFKRPFCDEFVDFCFSAFDVGVWSSRRKVNVDSVVDYIMGSKKRDLLFCWDQSRCTITGFKTIENRHKPLVLKELKKLWDKEEPGLPWEDGKYSESNTLLIDDSPYKALCNPPHTAIFPYPYSFRDENDLSLGPGGDIRVYLEGLAMAGDVQLYVQEHPFGQQAITSSNRSWGFYSRIIKKFTIEASTHS